MAALQAKGVACELVENEKPRMYYADQHGVCPYVLKLKDSRYDVGFDLQGDGTYSPVFDGWDGEVGKQVGVSDAGLKGTDRTMASIGRLLQEYSKAAVIEAAVMQGHTVDGVIENPDGSLCVQLTTY